MASALLDDRTLKELYQYLNSLSIANSTTTTTEFKHQDQVTYRNYSGNEQFNIFSSLKMSLDLSWKTLEQRNDDSCRFFALMGLLPSGVGEEEFEKIWGKDWDIYKDILLRSSLLLKLKKNETTQYRLYYSFALNRNYFQKGIHSWLSTQRSTSPSQTKSTTTGRSFRSTAKGSMKFFKQSALN